MLTGTLPFRVGPPDTLRKLPAPIVRGYDPPSNISKECQDVLLGLMETEDTKRMTTMVKLRQHPWLNKAGPPDGPAPLTPRLPPSDVEGDVITHMVKRLHMNEAQIRHSILDGKVNAMSATYQLLCKRKKNGMGSPGLPRVFPSTNGMGSPGMPGVFPSTNGMGSPGTPGVFLSTNGMGSPGMPGGFLSTTPEGASLDCQGLIAKSNLSQESFRHVNKHKTTTTGSIHDGENISESQKDNPYDGIRGVFHTQNSGFGLDRILQRKQILSQQIRLMRPDVLQDSCLHFDLHTPDTRMGESSRTSLMVPDKKTISNAAGLGEWTGLNLEEGLKKIKLYQDRTSLKDPNLVHSYRDCLKQLRMQREKPGRGILKVESSKEVPIVGRPQDARERTILRARSTSGTTDVHSQGGRSTPEKGLRRGRSTSAGTKSVRFNLDHDSPRDEPPTSGLSLNPQARQLERLVLKRLGTDKTRKEYLLSLEKMGCQTYPADIGSYATSDGSNRERMRALRQMQRPNAQKTPRAPPNSAMRRSRTFQHTSPICLASSETSTGNNTVEVPYQHQGSKTGALTASSQSELAPTEEKFRSHCDLKLRNDEGMRMLHVASSPRTSTALALSATLPPKVAPPVSAVKAPQRGSVVQ